MLEESGNLAHDVHTLATSNSLPSSKASGLCYYGPYQRPLPSPIVATVHY